MAASKIHFYMGVQVTSLCGMLCQGYLKLGPAPGKV